MVGYVGCCWWVDLWVDYWIGKWLFSSFIVDPELLYERLEVFGL